MRRQIHIGWRATVVLAAGLFSLPNLHALPQPSAIQQQAAEAVVRDLKLDSESGLVERNLIVLAPFTALPDGTAIHVTSARASFAGTWVLRLDCGSRRDCLPFHAMLRLPEAQPLRLAGTGAASRLLEVSAVRNRPAVLVHSGEQVTLVEEFSGLHLRAKAVCLGSGGLGDQVRVQNKSTHRILQVTVAGESLVRVGP